MEYKKIKIPVKSHISTYYKSYNLDNSKKVEEDSNILFMKTKLKKNQKKKKKKKKRFKKII